MSERPSISPNLIRPIYAHFLDKVLLTTLGLYDKIRYSEIERYLRLALFSTTEPIYFSASLVFENKFARRALFESPALFQTGAISLLMQEYFFEDFAYSKRTQYVRKREERPEYFDDTWRRIEDLNPTISHRAHDTTAILGRDLVADLRSGGIEQTVARLRNQQSPDDLNQLAKYVIDDIENRGQQAITPFLYHSSLHDRTTSHFAGRVFDLKTSEFYIRSQLSERDGTIMTGIPGPIDYFSYLCPSFPFDHFPFWIKLFRRMGILGDLLSRSDADVIALRSTSSFVRLVQGARKQLQVEVMSVDESLGENPEHAFSRMLARISPKNVSIGSFASIEDALLATSAEFDFTPLKDPMQKQLRRKELNRDVFVIHGRDEKRRKAIFELLLAGGLRPLEWESIVKMTGKGSPYIGEVLDAGFSAAQAVVVMFTGDDLAHLDERLLLMGEAKEPATPQPRPNVILEAGMALAKHPTRTIIVEIGRLRTISDLSGRHTIRLQNNAESRKILFERLETAGCDVDLTGSDWMSAGEF